MIEKIAIIGCGLLGGSIGHAVKKYLPNIDIYAYDHLEEVRIQAKKIGFIDHISDNIQDMVQKVDIVFLCTPLSFFGPIAEKIIPFMKKGAILTDTGSVKQSVITAITPYLRPDIHFIPAHPIAGTEKSGPSSGFADLFQNKHLIFTPLVDTDIAKYNLLKEFWEKIGAFTEDMEVKHHDLVFAVVSHIPHLVAYNIVGTAANLERVSENEVIRYAASGFRDFTRLASSNPVIWRDVFLENKEAVIEMLGRFTEDLFELQRAIRYEDAETLEAFFTKAQGIREKIQEK